MCFGGVQDSFEKIQIEFSNLKFKKIKQTHSSILVEVNGMPTEKLTDKVPDNLIEADAHYTAKPNVALLIATADCLPIMIYCQQTQRVAALHAGWRGVENKITEKTLKKLIATGSTNKNFKFWVGPHIMQKSFEVDSAVQILLTSAQHGLRTDDFSISKNNKYYIDLKKIVYSQIQHALALTPDTVFVDIDTKIDTNYYSYRREQSTQKRNLSFICLLD